MSRGVLLYRIQELRTCCRPCSEEPVHEPSAPHRDRPGGGRRSGAPALAATPTSGTVSDTSTSVQWSAGPFVAPNVTGATGAVTCGPTSATTSRCTSRPPAGYGDTHQLTIKVGSPNAAADFDVYLLDPSGAVVASSASSSDPEVIVTAPTSGDFTVRVCPYAPLGESVTGTATLTDVPANPAPSTATPPTFSQYGDR